MTGGGQMADSSTNVEGELWITEGQGCANEDHAAEVLGRRKWQRGT
jgi:hypothetical protein